jgi:hypothetical protein
MGVDFLVYELYNNLVQVLFYRTLNTMPANNVEQIKIWKQAHTWLKQLSDVYKSMGRSSDSMTRLASEAILAIPMPNGHVLPINPYSEEKEKP